MKCAYCGIKLDEDNIKLHIRPYMCQDCWFDLTDIQREQALLKRKYPKSNWYS